MHSFGDSTLNNNTSFFFSVLRRDFDTPPYSQQIELGKQAQLRCHPPKGSPPPRVIAWLKNGVKIADKNFIQSATGNLLIIQARMEDSGNYTCVVSNDVLTRKSPVAVLTIYGKFQLDHSHKLPSQTRLSILLLPQRVENKTKMCNKKWLKSTFFGLILQINLQWSMECMIRSSTFFPNLGTLCPANCLTRQAECGSTRLRNEMPHTKHSFS